jgi:hypothetical protein
VSSKPGAAELAAMSCHMRISRACARVESGTRASPSSSSKSAYPRLDTSTTARSVKTLEGAKIAIPMRIWPTVSAHLRLGTLQRKETQIEEQIPRDNSPMP